MSSIRDAKMTLRADGSGTINVDGVDITRAVRSITVESEPCRPPQLNLELTITEVEIDGGFHVVIPDRLREALVALGWTPPPNS